MKETLPSDEPITSAVLKVLAEGATRHLREVFKGARQRNILTPKHLAVCLLSPPLVHGAVG